MIMARSRQSPAGCTRQRASAARALALATAAQTLHFAEETWAGFYVQFPALLGLPAMSLPFFLAFNLAWLAIWIASIEGLKSSRPVAFFAAWFLAIAGMLNGIAHPLMAIRSGGYFPGLATALLTGFAGAWLWIRLFRATR